MKQEASMKIIHFMYICVFAFIISCNETTNVPENSNQLFWHVVSTESISPENTLAKAFLSYKKKGKHLSNCKVNKNSLVLMKLEVEDEEGPVDVIIAKVKANDKTPRSMTAKNKEGSPIEFKINDTNIYYIPSLEKSIREDRYIADASKKKGIARYTYPDGSQITYTVEGGLPVEKMNSNNTNLKKGKECVDCGTADCYKTAKDACDSDADCKLLCDGLDWFGGWCSASIATACFINNI